MPILLIAVAMSAFTLVSNHFIEPAANRQVRNIVSNASGDLLSSAIQTSTFTKLDDGVYFDVSDVGSGGELHGIFISDKRDKTKSVTYYARSGQLVHRDSDQVLVLQDGEAQNKDLQTGKVSIIKFKAYALDLALFPASSHVTHYYPKEDTTPTSSARTRTTPITRTGPTCSSSRSTSASASGCIRSCSDWWRSASWARPIRAARAAPSTTSWRSPWPCSTGRWASMWSPNRATA